MNKEYFFLEREISWLSFNERVLQEAADRNNPLIERMRFLGIYSNNLDEFHKVRFANIKRQIFLDEQQSKEPQSKQALKRIKSKILKATLLFYRHYNALLLEMARDQIFLVNEKQLTPDQGKWIEKYFYQELRKYTCPIMLSEHTALLKVLKEDYTYLVVEIINENNVQYALVEVPSDKVSRFIVLPSDNAKKHKSIILLDNIYRYCLPNIFKGFFKFNQLHAYSMKMTRDAEYDVVQEMETSLIDIMSTGLKQRLTAKAVQFVYQKEMPNNLVTLLIKQLNISSYDSIIAGERYHNFKDFMDFPSLGKNNLIYKTLIPLKYNRFKQYKNGFEAIKAQDVLLYYPYYAFEHILELLRQASFDPLVTEIEINIYRVARDSRIINSMINAAKNGKKVTVVVELQARFDEAANIRWAKKLTESGAKVIFSPPGLKIHAKLFIISRVEQKKIVQYAHIGTGNFNEKTATLYTDFALITANEKITQDIKRVFDFIENPYRPVCFEHLLISPQNTREKLYRLLDRQIQYALRGERSELLIKINNLEDEALIEKLYAASQSGVIIRLIVRGVCTLIPNIPGLSENIHVISIVDRFLEHARVYIFYYGNESEIYLSSADWMTRNLDYRIEAGVKLEDKRAQKTVMNIVELQWKDDVKARVVDKDLNNKYVEKKNNKRVRSQMAIYDYLKNLEQRQLEGVQDE